MALVPMEIETPILTKATSASNALSNAKYFVILVGKGNINADAPIALSLFIPIAALETSTNRYWEVSDSYNTGAVTHLQVQARTSGFSNPQLYQGATLISNATYEWYYC